MTAIDHNQKLGEIIMEAIGHELYDALLIERSDRLIEFKNHMSDAYPRVLEITKTLMPLHSDLIDLLSPELAGAMARACSDYMADGRVPKGYHRDLIYIINELYMQVYYRGDWDVKAEALVMTAETNFLSPVDEDAQIYSWVYDLVSAAHMAAQVRGPNGIAIAQDVIRVLLNSQHEHVWVDNRAETLEFLGMDDIKK